MLFEWNTLKRFIMFKSINISYDSNELETDHHPAPTPFYLPFLPIHHLVSCFSSQAGFSWSLTFCLFFSVGDLITQTTFFHADHLVLGHPPGNKPVRFIKMKVANLKRLTHWNQQILTMLTRIYYMSNSYQIEPVIYVDMLILMNVFTYSKDLSFRANFSWRKFEHRKR